MGFDLNTAIALEYGMWTLIIKFLSELVFFVTAPLLLFLIYLKLSKISRQLKTKEIDSLKNDIEI